MQTLFPHRAVIRLSGPDVDSLLQGIITQDITRLKEQPMIYSAMLSAQGKVVHDFFIFAEGEDRLVDIDASYKDALIKKLKMYKLRSKVTIEDASDHYQVAAAWGDAPVGEHWQPDPRLPALGWRAINTSLPNEDNLPAYEAHRLLLGVPDVATDASERDFALELGFDQLHGVSFTKGCFVGQEPTARMHYRKVLRKGLFQVRAKSELPPLGTPVVAGEKTLGEMRSSCGGVGLAFCRMDPVQTAQAAGQPIFAENLTLQLEIPAYMRAKWQTIQAHQKGETVVE